MKSPNILVFMTDQQRACTVLPDHPYKAKTPALDAFRGDAVTFKRHYCPAPHCCPSRASFFTGLMPTQHGIWHNVSVTNAISRGLSPNVRPWSVDLAENGYALYFSGKWHVSNHQQPRDYGWNHVFPDSMCWGEGKSLEEQEREARLREEKRLHDHPPFPPHARRGPGEIQRPGQTPYVHYGSHEHPSLGEYFISGDPENPFNDKAVVEASLDQLNNLPTDQPWCFYIGTLGPHDPYIPPQRFLDQYRDFDIALPDTFDDPMTDKPALYRRTRDRFTQLTPEEHIEALRHYLAFCSYEDWLFGRVIDQLKSCGQYDNTLILYLSDHGDYMGDHGLWCKGLPAFLSGYHVPAIVKMPDGSQAGTQRDELVSLCDFGPTLLDIAGIQTSGRFAGRSLLPVLKGRQPSSGWRDALYFQTNGNETYGIQRSILTDRWRFVYNGFDYDELYDLEKDPGQLRNLAASPEHQDIIRDLYKKIWTFGLDHDEQLLNDYIMTALADYGPGIALDSWMAPPKTPKTLS